MSDPNDLSQFTTEVLRGILARLLWFSETRLEIKKPPGAADFMIGPQTNLKIYPGQPVQIFNRDPANEHCVAIQSADVFGCKEIRDIPANGSVTIAARMDAPIGTACKFSLCDDPTGGGPEIVTMNPPGGGP